MFQYHCLNPIAEKGLGLFDEEYKKSEDLQECDAVLVRSAKMHDMELPESVKVIARAGAGVNNIPVKDCAEKGVVVFNTPGANANGVKELVLAGMLLASRDIVGGIEWVAKEKDQEDIDKLAEKQKKQFAGCEIMGKKLGIIGLGAIGAMVANGPLLHLEWKYTDMIHTSLLMLAWNLSRTIKHIKSLDEIYSQCDYITIHVPLLDSTKQMINKEALDKMKDGVVLLNFARDLLVDEDALIEALDSGKVKKYVTDFANHTVAGHKGILVTPHLGASTEESEENCAVMAVKEVRDFLENGNIKNSVNFPNCDMGTCVAVGRIAICHKNIPNMISQFTKILGAEGLNIADMTNKSKGEYAYTLIDLESAASREALDELKAIEGVSRVRVVK
ncbi:phosphoglycerate dehydrogenase [Blautia wexlerae]|nr:phosphoglycerate dehydrogenase [Blautia wexlerae]